LTAINIIIVRIIIITEFINLANVKRQVALLQPGTHWQQSQMSKQLLTKMNTFVKVE